MDPLVETIRERVADLVKMPMRLAEDLQVSAWVMSRA